jgi:integrase
MLRNSISKATAGGYACQLRKILSLGVPALSGSSKRVREKLLASPISLLDAEAVRRFKKAMFDKAKNEKAIVKARTNINSALRQAKSMFTDRAMDLYNRNGLNVPKPDDFQAEKSMKGPKKRYRLPNIEIIEKLFAEIPELKASNSHHYIARLLGLYAGLRPNEIRWLLKDQVRFNGYWYIAIEVTEHFSPKHYHVRDIPIPENLAKHLLAICERNDSEFIIGGNQNYRSDKLFREINTHLRNNFFVGIQKPSHELRKLFASVLAKHHDRDTTQEWLGHEDPTTTILSYVDKRTPMTLVEFWQVNAKLFFGGPAFADKV